MKKLKILIIALLFVQIQVYSQEKTKVTFGVNAAYHIGTSSQKENTSSFLFLNSAQSAGLELSFPLNKKGSTRIKLAADYITGTNNKEYIAAYAKENNIEYTSYKFSKTNPNGFSIMASPQFMLFPKSQNKKLPLMWLDLKAGALFSNQQNLQFFLGQTTPNQEIKSNAVSFVYNPTLVVNIMKTKKLFINLKAGYSNFGGFGFGLNISEQDCHGAPCPRCQGPGCW